MLDFKQNNKVIEYNGTYWHSNDIDDIRYSILKDMGFEIMFVTSEEYNRNNKNNEIINKCVKFLQC
jgi:very-short-patch-repair endonuclease